MWASIGVGVGLLYGGLVPPLIDLDSSHEKWWHALAFSVLFYWLPFGLVTLGAMAWLDGSAYMFLMKWVAGTWLLGAALGVLGTIRTAVTRRRSA